jgi:threonine dehydratase
MAGQGTAALEVLRQFPQVDAFFCPIGGGGLLCGCATAFKETSPSVAIYGVEPEGAGDYHASRISGRREIWESINTIADGLRASSVGELNFPILNQYVDHTLVVSDTEIKAAMRLLYEQLKIVSEPSGAVSLAGFIKEHRHLKGNAGNN